MGDEVALAALYDRHGGLVFTLALRVVGDRHLAEEVLQDTFLRCWDGARGYDPQRGQVAGWLMGVARNRAIDLLRSRQHQARLREQETLGGEGGYGERGYSEPEAPPAAVAWPPQLAGSHGAAGRADATDALLLRQVVRSAMDGLPEVQRQAIELSYYADMTQAEIARRLDTPLGTVKTRVRDGLERLRHLLLPALEADGEAIDGHR